ncbi:MAG: HAD family hydrolase [Flavobacteriaceae bacterium]|nr:HAD family hydrolase [Flavobacteriaceae bacterium]
MIDYSTIKVIAFDADDTLWVNETYFREVEDEFARLLSDYETENKLGQELFKTEMDNLNLYGYGVKSFMLSMIESALEVSNYQVDHKVILRIIELGKQMLEKPIELLEGVEDTLKALKDNYKLILVTKGDLLDQERKLEKSGLEHYFNQIEIVSDKKASNYQGVIHQLEVKPSEFLMIGNSLKSDVLPLLEIGAKAIHIPFHTTWAHELIEKQENDQRYHTISNLTDIVKIMQG